MPEESIFLDALEIKDPTARARFLDLQCGDNAQLRHSIDSLIAAHERSGDFLASPLLLRPDLAATTDKTNASTRIDGSTPKFSPISLTFLEPATSADSLGRLAHYEIREVLGRGGCGIVLKALDEKLARIVAIKVIAPEFAGSATTRQRFLREARSAASIDHPNVVHTFSVEEHPVPFLAMEYVEGSTLQQRLNKSGPLEIAEFVHVARQISAGLAAAHARGLIHRDIKPGNILLDATGQHVQISDFGLARSVDDTGLTRSGEIAGTPLFMSPEQASNAPLDSKSDLFSLGSVFYAMCVGQSPFQAPTTYAVLRKVVEETPPKVSESIPTAPAWLDAIVTILLAKNPEERTLSADDVAELLQTFEQEIAIHGCVISSPAALQLPPAPLLRRSHWKYFASACMLMLLVLFGVGKIFGITNLSSDPPATPAAGTGELIVSIDDPDVTVQIAGLDREFSQPGIYDINLPPGEHFLIASQQGQEIERKPITVVANQRSVSKFAAVGPAQLETLRNKNPPPVEINGGAWKLENGQLSQTDLGAASLLFGDPAWTDYDVTFEVKFLEKMTDSELCNLYFRAQSREQTYRLSMMESHSRGSCIFQESSGKTQQFENSLWQEYATDVWYQVRFEVRGFHCKYMIEDQTRELTIGDDFSAGLIGLGTWNSSTAWRNLQVTSPEGKVLWEGFPNIGKFDESMRGAFDAMALADRRAAEFIVQNNGRFRIHFSNQDFTTVESLPSYPFRLRSVTFDRDHRLQDEDLKVFADTRHLTDIRLGHSRNVTNQGIAYLTGNRSLSQLDIEETGCTGAVLDQLLECKELKFLTLDGLDVDDDDLATLTVSRFPELRSVSLNCTNVSDVSIARFAQFPYLIRLSLKETKVTDAGLAELENNIHIAMLDLQGTAVTDACLVPMRKYHQLQTLKLTATQITDQGLLELSRHKRLVNIYLDQTDVTAQGIQKLQEAIPKCRIFAEFEPDRIAAEYVRALGGSIHINDNRQSSFPKDSPLPDNRFRLTLVSFEQGEAVTDQGLKNFEHTKNLRSLFFQHAEHITTSGLAYLQENKDLENLRFTFSRLNVEGLALFTNCSQLRTLSLVAPQLSDNDLGLIRQFKNLESLELVQFDVTDDGLKNIVGLENLTQLELADLKITNEGLAQLKHFPKLKSLRLSFLKFDDAGLIHLQQLPELASLKMLGDNLSDEGLLQLHSIQSLKTLEVTRNPAITAAAVEALSEALPECRIVWDGGTIATPR